MYNLLSILPSKIKDLFRRKNSKNNIVNNTIDGKIALEVEEVKSGWSEDIADLLSDEQPDSSEIRIESVEWPLITKNNVKAAIASI